MLKFWLAVTPDVQLERFKEREKSPFKNFKITPDDWRNRDKWKEYAAATNEMLTRADVAHAPWHLVSANDKRYARLQVLRHIVRHWKTHADPQPGIAHEHHGNRPATAADFDVWLPLWKELPGLLPRRHRRRRHARNTWDRLLDPTEPMHVALAYDGGKAIGMVHWIFHRSTWTAGDYCYLQDLYA